MRTFLDRFEIGFNSLNNLIAWAVAISIGLFAILIPFDLLLRSLQLGNLWWLHEGIEYVLYAGVFLSAAWVLQKGAHVRVDVVLVILSRNMARRLEQTLNVIGALLCLSLSLFGILATITDFVDESMPDKLLAIANWYMMLIFAISFLMLAIEFLLRARRAHEETSKEKTAASEAGF